MNSVGLLVCASDAVRNLEYFCPDCSCSLVLHAGSKVTRHFAHKANSTCTGESVAHKTAKRLLMQAILENSKSEGKRIMIACECTSCKTETTVALPPNSFSTALEEQRIGEFICDVVAFRETTPVLAIEVLATHAVDERKAESLNIPWIEVTAEQVLLNPYYWRPKSARLKPVVCTQCKAHAERLRFLAEKWSQPLFQPPTAGNFPGNTYLAEVETCFRCKEQILVYWWSGVPFAEEEPPKPRPQTIQHRYSKKFGGSYWANTCPNCESIQGDNFLFLGPNPKFRNVPLRSTRETRVATMKSATKFVDHMLRNFRV
jgi:hypothetical protein